MYFKTTTLIDIKNVCLLNSDNVACSKWLALSTDGSVVKMAVALPHSRGDSRIGAELPLVMTKFGDIISGRGRDVLLKTLLDTSGAD